MKWERSDLLSLQELDPAEAAVRDAAEQPQHPELGQAGQGRGRVHQLLQRSQLLRQLESRGDLLHRPHHRHGLHTRICHRWDLEHTVMTSWSHDLHCSLQPGVAQSDRDCRGVRGGGQRRDGDGPGAGDRGQGGGHQEPRARWQSVSIKSL